MCIYACCAECVYVRLQKDAFMSTEIATQSLRSCRWEVLEAATGAPVLFGASLPANTTSPQVRMHIAVSNDI